ncbi:phosphatase PAP2 family protein [Nocardia sp. NPDC051052]|uniref:phosphatase PAP2 family protein n=1 Tax=Nocardia sp. NPDC051052 TaxID=3364322 RepID=UPI00378D5DD2
MSAVVELLDTFVTEVSTEAATAEIAITVAAIAAVVLVGSLLANRYQLTRARPEYWRIVRAVALAIVFATLAVQVARSGWLTGADAVTLEWFRTHRNPALTTVALVITDAGSPVGLAVVGVLLAGVAGWRLRTSGAAVLVLGVVAVSFGASTLTKLAVARARPPAAVALVSETDFSFPSGHVTGTTALAGAVLLAYLSGRPSIVRRVAAVLLSSTVVVLVAATRLYLGVHWLTDVIGGALLGVTMVLFGAVIAPRLLSRAVRPAAAAAAVGHDDAIPTHGMSRAAT